MESVVHTSFVKRLRWLDFFFYFFILLVLGNRVLLFTFLNLDHIDSDQPTMWLGARHFSEGLFYEPRFYGQSYNTLLEALLAVPFVRIGVPVYYAVPIVTHILSLVPFLFMAVYLFHLQKKLQALLVLILLLFLPTGYDIMNAIPRGFVSGIFFTTPFILSIQNPTKLRYLLLNSFCAGLAYLVNPNSLLISFPLFFYLFLINFQSKKAYLYVATGFLLVLPFAYLLNHFYTIHPDYIQHPFENKFSGYYFTEALNSLDQRFANITFFEDEKCIYLLLTLFICGVLFFRQNRKVFYAYTLFLLFILLSFFSSKVADGSTWVYFSYSRMYLGIPVILSLFLSTVSFSSQKFFYILIPLALLFTGFKLFSFEKNIAYQTDNKKWIFMHLGSIKNTLEITQHYKKVCLENKVNDLVIMDDVFCKEELGFGGPAIDKNFPNTLLTHGERRTWRIEEEKKRLTPRFVILCADYDLDRRGYDSLYNFTIKRLDFYGCFLVENNKKTLPHFLQALGRPINGKKED
ncbi:hypothetical protein CNR22_20075 [Sphingobacteriaceae bacterium]|nr:hypothetical protein CNR22_20075 [Sphingobacteriaceae bacterium]